MSERASKWMVLAVALGLAAAACSKAAPAAAPRSAAPAATPPFSAVSSPSPSAAIPTAKTTEMPVTYGYYDGHVDTMLSTDVSDKSQAASKHINYSAALINQPAKTFPSLYILQGTAAPNQPLVFGSEPGESDYSPIWQEIDVQWKSGAKPALLVKDDQIKELASKGELTMTATSVVLDCPIVKVSSSKTVPSAKTIQVPVTYGYYDGHVDTMLSTDVSDKSQAKAQSINYSAALKNRPPATFPSLYLIKGAPAPGQPMVFGSEPGETDYSPVWQEIDVAWKSGATPVLLVKDDQIKELASKGEVTMTATPVVLNCPIVKVA